MAEGKIQDSLGKTVNGNAKALLDSLSSMCGAKKPYKGKDKEAYTKAIGEVRKLLEEIKVKLVEPDSADKIAKELDAIKKILDDSKKETKEGLHDVTSKIQETIGPAIKRAFGGKGGGVGGGGIATAGGGGAAKGTATSKGGNLSLMGAMGGQVLGLMGGLKTISPIFADLNSQEQDFMVGMRQIAFQTQGITGNLGKMQQEFQKTGKVVTQTGYNMTVFQNTLLKQLGKGIKSRESEIGLMKTALNLSTMIGTGADETADMFHEWQMSLNMSNNQMAEVSRGAQEVARATGVTGDNLMRAMKTAEQFATQMRNAATLTAASSKNLMMMAAAMQKYGVGADQVSRFMGSMSSSADLYLQASKETQALMFSAAASVGKVDELSTGTITKTKAGMAGMAKGLENILGNFGTTMEGIDNLDPQKLMKLNLSLQSAYGIQAGELKQMWKSWKEGSKSFAEQVADINTQLKNSNLTTQERIKLEQQLQQMTMNKGFEFLTAVDEAGKVAGTSLEEAVQKATKNLGPDMAKDLKDMGVNLQSPIDTLKGVAEITAKQLKAAGGKDMTSQIEKAIGANDMASVRNLLSQMNTEQQKIGVDQAKKLDPLTQMAYKTDQLNETLREYTRGALAIFNRMLMLFGPMNVYLAALLAQQAGGGKLLGFLGKAFKRKGGSAAEVAGAGAAAAPTVMEKAKGGITKGATGAAKGTDDASQVSGLSNRVKSIAEAAQNAGAALKKISWGQIKQFGMALVKGGAVLLILVAGLVALAAAIVLISKAIMKITGLDAGEAAKIADAVGSLLWSAAKIAFAVVVGAVGLTILGALASTAWALAPLMLLGAAALFILTPAMLLLAAGLIKLTGAMLSISPDPSSAAATATNISSLFEAATGIAWSVIKMAGMLSILAVFAGFSFFLLPLLALGIAGFSVLTPIMVLFATAIIGFCKLVLMIPGIKDAAAAAESISQLFKAASDISWAVVKMAGSLAILGAFAMFSFLLVPLMMAGAAALYVLTPAMIAFAAALVGLTKKALSVIGPVEEAAETAKNVAVLFQAANDIAGMIIKQVPKLIILGVLSGFSWLLVGLMWAGVAAFGMIAAPVVALMAGIAIMGKTIGKMLSPKEAENISKTIQGLSNIIEGVSNALKTFADKLVPLSRTWSIFGLAFGGGAIGGIISSQGQIKAGMVALCDMFSEKSGFIKALKESFPNPENAKVAAELMSVLSTLVEKTGDAMSAMADKLIPLTRTFSFLGMSFGEGVIGKITDPEIQGKINSGITALMDMFGEKSGLIATLIDGFPNPENARVAAELMSVLATLVENTGKAMVAMADKLIPLTNTFSFLGMSFGEGVIGKITDPELQEKIGAGIGALTGMFGEKSGLIATLIDGFPNPENARVAAQLMAVLADLVSGTATAMNAMAQKIIPLTESFSFLGFSFGSGLIGKMTDEDTQKSIRDGISALCEMLGAKEGSGGIIGTLMKNFPNPEDARTASELMKILAEMTEGLAKALDALNTNIIPLTESFLWFDSPLEDMEEGTKKFTDWFEGFASLLKTGIIDPVNNIFADTGVESFQKLISLGQMIEVLPSFLEGIGQNLAPMVQGNAFGEAPLESLAAITQKFGNYFTGIAGFLKQGIVDPINALGSFKDVEEATKKLDSLSQMLDKLVSVMDKLGAVMAKITSPGFDTTTAAASINDFMASLGQINPTTAMGATGMGVMGGAGVPASAGPINDMYDGVRAQYAVKDGASQSPRGDMAQISDATNKQVALLGVLHEDNQEIIKLLSPVAMGGGEKAQIASTATQNNQPQTVSGFGTWRYKPQQNANKAVGNTLA